MLTSYHDFLILPVVSLTLIDLPGLTKVAVEGQPESIVEDIEKMVRTYVEKRALPTLKNIIIIFNRSLHHLHRSSSSSSSNIFIIEQIRIAADVKIRKTPTTKARTLDNLLEDGAVHIRK
ncbi:putative Dynamin superfamily, P-loop containing nucleoside triphosphate hydrolase [Helianthus annuus]|uniref:Dynamin superfamily, P-loop containing nucleoside triphosphate hydrolase n=1 Tax=Helianthus annuus TaxID=4232 RepID=A0A251UF34_HELAN|nr:putative Dynamin superfamily, P-loop containing nucleoside triphosphate hydrolase [Helianthus annuus]KAJ0913966.1 putative Dynamin superfamily, P-loop containing nucleoside triphosphate hydrolase [Helianthus annuus]